MKTLSQLAVGETGRIERVDGVPHLRQRLFDMGLTKGRTIQIEKTSALGSPLIISLLGYSLVLGKREADAIFVEELW